MRIRFPVVDKNIISETYFHREFTVTVGKKTMPIGHVHCTSWPDKMAPDTTKVKIIKYRPPT